MAQISSLKPGLPDSKLLYRLREDGLQGVFGPVFHIPHQLVDTESPVQALLPAILAGGTFSFAPR